jgi:ppGpp synthetase/RelA/SpoT-type nucleotidyltranferase
MFTLSKEELELLLESLDSTKQAYQNYSGYPSLEFKAQRIKQVDELRAKIKAMLKESKHGHYTNAI